METRNFNQRESTDNNKNNMAEPLMLQFDAAAMLTRRGKMAGSMDRYLGPIMQ